LDRRHPEPRKPSRGHRFRGLAVVLATVAFGFGIARAGDPPAVVHPSVLLITLDTTRADHLGCYGAVTAATPRLDALARSGVRFDLALSPVPLTLPAHASILSGRVPRRHGIRDNAGFHLTDSVPLLTERFRDAGYATAAFVSAAVLDREGGLNRGFAIYDDTVRIGDRRTFDYQERAGSQTVDAALGSLPSLKPPFFLWVHLYDPHFPYVPPEPYKTRFAKHPYDGEIAFDDAQVGRLLDALRVDGETVVVAVAGDHGESLGDHGERTHGVFLYQSTQRVPLILYGRGVPVGRTITVPVGLVDLAPTLLELAGLPALPDTDGRSLLPYLRGSAEQPNDYEMETFYPSLSYGWAPLTALVSWPYKYIAAPRPELYELPTDPVETHDLTRDRPARAADFTKALAARIGSGAAPRPDERDDSTERRERLASLGYVGGSPAPTGGGIDPKDGVGLLVDLDAARQDIQLGNPQAALPRLKRLLAANRGNVPARLALGQAQLATEQIDAAIATYRSVTKIAGTNALAWFDYGNALARRASSNDEALASAKAAYEHALSLDPRHADTYLNYAALVAQRHHPDQAREVLSRGRRAGVEDPTLETEIGVLEIARHDAAAARAAFERALALDPRQPVALEGLGKIAYAVGDYAKSADLYARALKANPQAALAKTLGAIRLYHLDDRPGARAAFERALALSPAGSPDVADLQAMIADLSR
jgi:choline-sulfatase